MSTARTAYRGLAGAAHRIEPALLTAWRYAIARMAIDDTANAAYRSCMVIAPHPDDETIGCGATIARKRAAGTDVLVVVVADGRYAQIASTEVGPSELASLRAAEVVRACDALGVPDDRVVQLGYVDTEVPGREQVLADELHALLVREAPDEVLLVSGFDHHIDHRAVHAAGWMALARLTVQPLVGEFPVWSWLDGPWLDQRQRRAIGRAAHLVGQPIRTAGRGRARAVCTDGFLVPKRAALAAHATQTSQYTKEATWAVMDDRMLQPFLGDAEIFLPPTPATRKARC